MLWVDLPGWVPVGDHVVEGVDSHMALLPARWGRMVVDRLVHSVVGREDLQMLKRSRVGLVEVVAVVVGEVHGDRRSSNWKVSNLYPRPVVSVGC